MNCKKLLFFFISLFFINLYAFSQTTKVNVRDSLVDLDDVIATAQKENKNILVYCYTTWCRHCNTVKNILFKNETIANFSNKNFITIALQFNSTEKDNSVVNDSKILVEHIRNSFNINCYPSFVVLDKNGQGLNKFIGASEYSKPFLANLEKSLDPSSQFYHQIRLFNKNPSNLQTLKSIISASPFYFENIDSLYAQYFNNQKKYFTPENLELLTSNCRQTTSYGFKMLYNYYDEWDSLAKNYSVKTILKSAVIESARYKILSDKILNEENLLNLYNEYLLQFPEFTKGTLNYFKAIFYDKTNESKKLNPILDGFSNSDSAILINYILLNDFAKLISQNSKKDDQLLFALEWINKAIVLQPKQFYLLFTKVSILKKLKMKKEAEEIEEMANEFITELEKELL